MQSVVVCYDLKCPTSIKCNLKHIYISYWAPVACKSVFNDEFYMRFVSYEYNKVLMKMNT